MQNLVSRIAGVDNEELANRGIGMGAAMGYTLKSIAYQFKGNNEESKTEGTDIISKVVNKANNIESVPVSGVSYENYSRNVMEDSNINPVDSSKIPMEDKDKSIHNNINSDVKDSNNLTGIKKVFNTGKEFMNLGMYMAEGRNFKTNSQDSIQKRTYNRNNINNTRREDKNEENNKIITMEVDDANE